MSRDLEETLGGLEPGCRDVVARLRAAREIEPTCGFSAPRRWRIAAPLVAASVTAVLLGAVVCRFVSQSRMARTSDAGMRIYTVAYAPTSEALEIIVSSQRADGSWANDFLTRQNAAALRASQDARFQLAYRRAVRYLRSKGLSPLTDEELSARGARAARFLAGV